LTAAVVAPTVAGEVVPVLQVEPPGPEHWFESEWRTYQSSASSGPVAGEYARIDLHNNSSNVLIVVDAIYMSSGVVLLFGFTAATTAIAGQVYASLVSPGDTRQGIWLGSAGRVGNGSSAGVLGQHLRGILPSNNTLICREPFVLGPGGSLNVGSGTVNAQMIVSFRWRERTLGPLEL